MRVQGEQREKEMGRGWRKGRRRNKRERGKGKDDEGEAKKNVAMG